MIQSLLLKNAIPFVMGMIISTASILGIIHYTQKKIEVSCPPVEITTQEVKCPDTINALEIEKMKGFKGRIEVKQDYTVNMTTDSVLVKRILMQILKDEGIIKLKSKRKSRAE